MHTHDADTHDANTHDANTHDANTLKAIVYATSKILKDESLVYGTFGLCSVIAFVLEKQNEIEYDSQILLIEMHKLFALWPKFSGNIGFPVPGDKIQPFYAYINSCSKGDLWDKSTKYGRSRWQLCRFMRKKARQLLKQYGEK